MLPSSAALISGSYVVKCGRTGSPEMRILSFAGDYLLEWVGKRGNKGSIDLRQLSDIRIGQETPIFQNLPADDLVDVSFSLILSDRTLDLVVASRTERQQWIDAVLDVSKMLLSESAHSRIADSAKTQLQSLPAQTKWKPAQLRAKFVELTNPAVRQQLLKLKVAATTIIGAHRLAHSDDLTSKDTALLDGNQDLATSVPKTLDILTACSTRLSAHLDRSACGKFQADILMSFDTVLDDYLSTSLPVEALAPLSHFLQLLSKAVTSAPQNCDSVHYSGVLPKLFSVIDHEVPCALRCDVMWLLGSLAFWSESCQFAVANQNFTSLLKFLHSSYEASVCAEAARLFGMVARSSSEFQLFCRDSGALQLLLNLCCCSSPRLKSIVAATLGRVCCGNAENLRLLQESGALHHLASV
jgi:hypothetical protein